MATRQATAVWEGTLKEGNGTVSYGKYAQPFNFVSRFEGSDNTNPEELLGAAHAGCFTMALNAAMFRAGFNPVKVTTVAKVQLSKGEAGFSISQIDLECEASVPDIDPAKFQEMAEATKDTCIVSRALSAVPMTLVAKLV
ncbi:MAG: OsmC family peroxiredoxin [Chloroflexi bacterium]|nr:OsmC family peroxiredoxin [Chloroflexota bacterium]